MRTGITVHLNPTDRKRLPPILTKSSPPLRPATKC
jgi:hypothetical protein